jgi:PAS domain-containing protein
VSLHPVILSISAALSVSLAFFVGRYRRAPGSGTFVLLLLAIATWCATGAAHWAADSLDAKIAWARLQYFGIATVTPLTLLFAYRFAGSEFRVPSSRFGFSFRVPGLAHVLLWTIPVLTIVAALTNQWHGALWPSITLTDRGFAVYEHGWWFWISTANAYALMLLATLVIARALQLSPRQYRGQFVLLLAGALLPWAGNLAYLAGLIPIEGLDPTPLMFTASGVLFAFALHRNRLFDLVPVARDQLVDSLADAVVVLDASRRVLDLNAAAQRLAHPAWFGRTLEDLFPFLDGAAISLDSA